MQPQIPGHGQAGVPSSNGVQRPRELTLHWPQFWASSFKASENRGNVSLKDLQGRAVVHLVEFLCLFFQHKVGTEKLKSFFFFFNFIEDREVAMTF